MDLLKKVGEGLLVFIIFIPPCGTGAGRQNNLYKHILPWLVLTHQSLDLQHRKQLDNPLYITSCRMDQGMDLRSLIAG